MTPWRDQAACRGMDPALFHPACLTPQSRGHNRAQRGHPDLAVPLAVCARCAVTEACADYATRGNIDHGIYGGLLPGERDRIRRARRTRGAS